MQSSVSQHKAVELATEAISELNEHDKMPLSKAASFVWRCMQFPGYLLDKVRTSGVGKVIVSTATAAGSAIFMSRLYDYFQGRTSNPMEVFSFPRSRTMRRLVRAERMNLLRQIHPNTILPYFIPGNRASGKRLFSNWSKSFRKYNRQKVFIPTSHKFTIPSYVKAGATGLGAAALGTTALKLTGRFFRKLFHRN